MSSAKDNPFAIVGVPLDAETAAIEAAYKIRAKQVHPDVGGSTEAMTELNLAMEELRDPVRRRMARARLERARVDAIFSEWGRTAAPTATTTVRDPLAEVMDEMTSERSREARLRNVWVPMFRTDSVGAVLGGVFDAWLSQEWNARKR